MLGQTFELSDLASVAVLAFIEIVLSSDNAIVLGLLAHALEEKKRIKALYIGLGSAFFLRAGALVLVSYILRFQWLQLVGAAYLLYLCIYHFAKKPRDPTLPPIHRSFWMTVLLIELFDLAFAIDSIIAGIVFIQPDHPISTFPPKLWIVYVGGMLGLVGIRYAADLFSKLLTSFPKLETSAYLMVGWIGLKLSLSSFVDIPGFHFAFWIGLFALFLLGLRRK